MPNGASESHLRDLLRLTLTPGLGPILIARARATLGGADRVLAASHADLCRIDGIGPERARRIAAGLVASADRADLELQAAATVGARLLPITSDEYPALLKSIPDAPPILYVRGQFDPQHDAYPLGIVGSRACTHYGLEQTARFAGALAQAGLTVVSGGARGIDTAAHQAALRAGGRTLVVLGCGLGDCYPPDNRQLFDRIVAEHRGALISELPIHTPPSAENFPARNRIISGLSLGIFVVEAGRKSGALITARVAAEDHGREVFALPSRVDSSAADGSLELLKIGGAQLVTHPDDILQALESPARHLHAGSHDARYPARPADPEPAEPRLFEPTPLAPPSTPSTASNHAPTLRDAALTPVQSAILQALDEPRTLDQLAAASSASPAAVRAELTVLEIRRRIVRHGTRFAKA